MSFGLGIPGRGKGSLSCRAKRRSTVWGCLLDVGMVYGQGLAVSSSLLPGGLSLVKTGPVCGIKKFFSVQKVRPYCGSGTGAARRHRSGTKFKRGYGTFTVTP